MQGKIFWYQSLFHRSFFFDKYTAQNVFVCPKVSQMEVRWPVRLIGFSYEQLIRLFLLFYLTTGQKPQVFTKSYNLRGVKKNKLVGFGAHLKITNPFVEKLLQQHLAVFLVPTSSVINNQSSCTFSLCYKTQDDDILAQSVKIFNSFDYRIRLLIRALSSSHVKTLVRNLKIPCY